MNNKNQENLEHIKYALSEPEKSMEYISKIGVSFSGYRLFIVRVLLFFGMKRFAQKLILKYMDRKID